MGKIVQTAGRNTLGEFVPEFAHFNDDVPVSYTHLHINFQNPTAPFVERIEFDLDAQGYSPVSYTHLDVYKRQVYTPIDIRL